MRLIVHCGLHKTASTHLQHLLHDHRDALAERGVHYARSHRFAAHHRAGWRLLDGDGALLDVILAQARDAGAETVIVSSEDLEGALFDPRAAQAVDRSAQGIGAAVEWHAVLRDPAEYFASLHAQLQWHVYADTLWMFAEAMNKGGIYMHWPAPNWGGTPYWFYCFDHLKWLDRFTERTGRRPLVHDYAAPAPYPGWRLLDRLGVADVVDQMPAAGRQNRRHDEDTVRNGYRARIVDAGGGELGPLIDAAVSASLAAVPECARLVGERFGPSHRAALDRYGRW